ATDWRLLRIDLFEQPFALEHHREQKARAGVLRVGFVHVTPEQIFGSLFFQRLGRGWRWRLKFGPPERKRLDVIVAIFPRVFTKIFAAKAVLFVKKKRVKKFTVPKFATGDRAFFSA